MIVNNGAPMSTGLYRGIITLEFAVFVLAGCGTTAQPSPFSEEVIRSYVSVVEIQSTPDGSLSEGGYIAGKVVVVNTGETIELSRFSAREQRHHIPADTISTAQDEIKLAIRASVPTEVGTVILLNWSKRALGETAAGTKYQLVCEVIVVDKSAHRIAARKTFVGDEPAFATLYGASPLPQIVGYINSLPRREATPQAAQAAGKDEGQGVRPNLRKYSDATNRLFFSYPTEWKEATPAEAAEVLGGNTSKYLTVVVFDPADKVQNVNVQVLPTAAEDLSEAALREFAQGMDRQFPDSVPGFRKILSRVAPFRDMASLEYVLEATRPDGVRLRQKQLRTGKPGREVAITFSASTAAYDKADQRCFKTIIDTLTFF